MLLLLFQPILSRCLPFDSGGKSKRHKVRITSFDCDSILEKPKNCFRIYISLACRSFSLWLIIHDQIFKKSVRYFIEFVTFPFTTLTAFCYFRSTRRVIKSVGCVDQEWCQRIKDVISCPDNLKIERCPEAGVVTKYWITMHNGVKVCGNGYYGSGMLNLLIESRGVHEPQEELVFEEVIRGLPETPVMLELGAYWSFYSLSLLARRPNAVCHMIEPDSRNLVAGLINFKLNHRVGRFMRAAVSSQRSWWDRTVSVDWYCETQRLLHLDVLHVDIQGFESAMLDGTERMLSEGKIDYVFISTHSNSLHQECRRKLQDYGYVIRLSVDLEETYSYDGLIFATHPKIQFNCPDVSYRNPTKQVG